MTEHTDRDSVRIVIGANSIETNWPHDTALPLIDRWLTAVGSDAELRADIETLKQSAATLKSAVQANQPTE